jgi:hypothetical protein
MVAVASYLVMPMKVPLREVIDRPSVTPSYALSIALRVESHPVTACRYDGWTMYTLRNGTRMTWPGRQFVCRYGCEEEEEEEGKQITGRMRRSFTVDLLRIGFIT